MTEEIKPAIPADSGEGSPIAKICSVQDCGRITTGFGRKKDLCWTHYVRSPKGRPRGAKGSMYDLE